MKNELVVDQTRIFPPYVSCEALQKPDDERFLGAVAWVSKPGYPYVLKRFC